MPIPRSLPDSGMYCNRRPCFLWFLGCSLKFFQIWFWEQFWSFKFPYIAPRRTWGFFHALRIRGLWGFRKQHDSWQKVLLSLADPGCREMGYECWCSVSFLLMLVEFNSMNLCQAWRSLVVINWSKSRFSCWSIGDPVLQQAGPNFINKIADFRESEAWFAPVGVMSFCNNFVRWQWIEISNWNCESLTLPNFRISEYNVSYRWACQAHR